VVVVDLWRTYAILWTNTLPFFIAFFICCSTADNPWHSCPFSTSMIEVVVITTNMAIMVLLVHIPMNNNISSKMLHHHCLAPTYCQSFANIVKPRPRPIVHRIARDPSCTFKKSVHRFANAIPCCGMTKPIMPFRVTRLYIPFHHDRIIARTTATRTLAAATTRRQRHHLPRTIVSSSIIVGSMKYWRPTITMQS
jgi:hypothetical protein